MIFVIAELRNYRQLARLRSAALPAVESGLAAALGSRGAAAGAGHGVWLAELGERDGLDPAACAFIASRARDFLAARRAELFGYAVIIAELPAHGTAGAADLLRETLEGAAEDEQLWIAPSCVPLFTASFEIEQKGRALRKVTGRRLGHAGGLPKDAQGPWIREGLVARVLEIVSPRLSGDGSREALLLHGPSGVGKTALLKEVASRVVGPGNAAPVLRLRTIFRRRSPLHPFLGSLDPSLLAIVPRYLHGPERAAWEEAGGLLAWLREPGGQEAGLDPLPDHVLVDFALGYGLYLLAWVRFAGEMLKPAVLICDRVDSYHPLARRLLARFLEDMLALPPFLPLLAATNAEVPAELAGIDMLTLYVNPLGKKEIRSLARVIFPGLELPEAVARRLRRRSGGLSVAVVSALHYMRSRGHIVNRSGSWTCTQAFDETLPSSHLSVSWYLIRKLENESLLLLYCLSLAGGLLDRQGILAFLSEAGRDPESAGRSIAGLVSLGLLEDEEALIPRFPSLRRKLEEVLGGEAAALRDRFLAWLMALWSAGRYRHPVLLFTFFARGGRTDFSLRILPELIHGKLDQNDPAGARVFCDPRTLEFSAAPTSDQRRELYAVTIIGRLRAALMEDDLAAAEAAETEVRRLFTPEISGHLRGEANIERGKFFLLRGEAIAALDELKQALLYFQEGREARAGADRGPGRGAHRGGERGEPACYLWLGAAMLAEARLGEAVEYLGLSQRMCHELGDAPGILWTAVYLADCLFIEGHYTRCLSVLDQGMDTARSLYRRDVELFLRFLKARALFQVGLYEECSLTLQACLCAATLYGGESSLPVLRAWLGRTHVHAGELTAGARLLESLEPTREVMIFLAEEALFAGAPDGAAAHVERGLELPPAARFPPPEAMSWRDGFAGVEGRCLKLSRGDALVQRTLLALRAYLKGKSGSRREGIRELHQLTRGEKAMDLDPAAHWYHYLYSRVLPEGGADVDDKGTIFSKALKGLQERASRIDGPSQRSSFLWRSRWNRMIMEEARERKLL